MNKRTYQFGTSYLSLVFGDITQSRAQVIVSSDDFYLSMGGGVSAAIHQAAGNQIVIDAAKKTPAQLGDVVITSAGNLPAQHIFHAITIGPGQQISAADVLQKTVTRCLTLLDLLNLDTIAFPAIGAGAARFEPEDVAVQMADVISAYLQTCDRKLEVEIYLFDHFGVMDQLDYIRFFEEFRARVPEIATHEIRSEASVEPSPPAGQSTAGTAPLPKDAPKQEQHQQLVHLASLETERNQLEDQLASATLIDDTGSIQSINQRLEAIKSERIAALRQLKQTKTHQLELFFSYAHEDEPLRDELAKHLTILERQGMISAWHDREISAGTEWKGEIDRHLQSAQIILLLISSDFLASDYCYDIEMKKALERHDQREAIVIPVVLRPVSWQGAAFAKLQALPENGKAVTLWDNQDAAFFNIAEGIRTAINGYLSRLAAQGR